MLVPISFGIGATLTTLVGTNIGAGIYRAQRLAWIGALMAGAIAAAIGLSWRSGPTCGSACSPRIPARSPRAAPISASSGRSTASSAWRWPSTSPRRAPARWCGRWSPILSRITIAVCGSLLALDVLGWGVRGLFTFVALGIVVVLRRARLLDHAAGVERGVNWGAQLQLRDHRSPEDAPLEWRAPSDEPRRPARRHAVGAAHPDHPHPGGAERRQRLGAEPGADRRRLVRRPPRHGRAGRAGAGLPRADHAADDVGRRHGRRRLLLGGVARWARAIAARPRMRRRTRSPSPPP